MTHLTAPVSSIDHILGPPNAPVTLVEYGDFECPNCAAAYPVIRGMVDSLGDRLRFAFRHFPIVLSHDHAQKAAEAAEAAGAQGKFWEMHDVLFQHQDDLDRESLGAYARMLNLDVERFSNELFGDVHADRVYRDVDSGQSSGVSWTPTFFLNGERYPIARDLDGLVRAVTQRVQQGAGTR
ncbi:MAG: DsbA family protein [Gemmatimonadales bacterium]